MNTFTHIAIGNLICSYVKEEYGIKLDRRCFIRGNYLPDFSIGLITNPHYIKNKMGFVEHEIAALAETYFESAADDKDYSKRLGILCHYCADFFCYAHSEHFHDNMAIHVLYEWRLHKFITSRLHMLESIRFLSDGLGADPKAIGAKLKEYHADYLRASATMGNDIVFSLQVCIETIVALAVRMKSTGGPGDLPVLEAFAC